ncbi:MAG: FAD-binding protein [Chloroflexi bacterium]|nr:FAD-binding protein [Chloroflexota bacterium]
MPVGSARASIGSASVEREADVVVVGAGGAGLPATIVAREPGATVVLLHANRDVGGLAILSRGHASANSPRGARSGGGARGHRPEGGAGGSAS